MIETWRSLKGGSLTIVAGDSAYRFSSLQVFQELEEDMVESQVSQKGEGPIGSAAKELPAFEEIAEDEEGQFPFAKLMDNSKEVPEKHNVGEKDSKEQERLGSTLYSDTVGSDTNIHAPHSVEAPSRGIWCAIV